MAQMPPSPGMRMTTWIADLILLDKALFLEYWVSLLGLTTGIMLLPWSFLFITTSFTRLLSSGAILIALPAIIQPTGMETLLLLLPSYSQSPSYLLVFIAAFTPL